MRALRWWWSGLRFRVRVRLNRALHGYDEFDWWEYASQASERAVKLLTIMRERGDSTPGGFGCAKCRGFEGEPWECPCKPFERWKEALDDMIYFHRAVAGEIDRLDLKGADKQRYRRGKWFYFKYYEALWD